MRNNLFCHDLHPSEHHPLLLMPLHPYRGNVSYFQSTNCNQTHPTTFSSSRLNIGLGSTSVFVHHKLNSRELINLSIYCDGGTHFITMFIICLYVIVLKVNSEKVGHIQQVNQYLKEGIILRCHTDKMSHNFDIFQNLDPSIFLCI